MSRLHSALSGQLGRRTSSGFATMGLAAGVLMSASPAQAFEHRHSIATGYQTMHVSSQTSGGFSVGSIPLSYLGRYGNTWAGWLRFTGQLPMRASDDFRSISPGAEYDRIVSLDATLGLSLRATSWWGWQVDASFGPHFFFTRFRSDYYVEWANSMMGVAVGASARRPVFSEYVAGTPELGLHLEGQWDFVDLMHGRDVRAGWGVLGQVSIGWAFGGKQ